MLVINQPRGIGHAAMVVFADGDLALGTRRRATAHIFPRIQLRSCYVWHGSFQISVFRYDHIWTRGPPESVKQQPAHLMLVRSCFSNVAVIFRVTDHRVRVVEVLNLATNQIANNLSKS